MIFLEVLLAIFGFLTLVCWIRIAIMTGWGLGDERTSVRTWRTAWTVTATAFGLLVLVLVGHALISRFGCAYQHTCAEEGP